MTESENNENSLSRQTLALCCRRYRLLESEYEEYQDFQKPDCPIEIYQGGSQSKGYEVLFFYNEGKKRFVGTAVFSSFNDEESFIDEESRYALDLLPGETKEISWMEGWTLRECDMLSVENNEHETLMFEVFEKPECPIVVTRRSALLQRKGNDVAIFTNEGQKRFVGAAIFSRPNGEKSGFFLDLLPGETKEIGWMEGWTFREGDEVTIESKEYNTRVWKN